jgi:hypothetical protein
MTTAVRNRAAIHPAAQAGRTRRRPPDWLVTSPSLKTKDIP